MKHIDIEGTTKTPQVKTALEGDALRIEIKGRSIPEDAKDFYQPLMDLVEEFKQNPSPKMIIDIHFDYMNTSTSKSLAILLKRIEGVEGPEKEVNWYYEKLDYDLKEAGEDYALIVNIPFNLIKVESN